MADRFDILKRLLRGGSALSKVPTIRPTSIAQKQVFDSFQKATQTLYGEGLIGAAERLERVKDYEEMDHYPEISRALDIYADDSMTYSAEGKTVEIISDDEKIVNELEELLYQRLDIDFHLWTWIRNMCKYGDHFNLLDIVNKEGVLGAIALPVGEIEREEGYNNDPNSLRFKWNSQGRTSFENYQVSHMRILGDDRYLPYGRSILDSSRKVWKQLLMAEDAMLIYRISRAPERRVFYVDVGNIPPKDVESYMQAARDKLKRIPVVSENNGQVDLRYNPESILEDFFIPVRGDRGSRIETLPGGENAAAIEDIEYLQNKLFISLGVPKSYLTAEEDLSGKSTLAQEDIKFARTIQRIQKIVVSELAKICLIHLYLKGYDESVIYNFDLKLTNPSTVTEMMNLELMDKRFDIARNMADSDIISNSYVQKNVLKLSDKEIATISFEKQLDAHSKFILTGLENGESGGAPQEGTPMDAPANEDAEEGSEDSNESTIDPSQDMKPYDPLGTREMPGYPKMYTNNEAKRDMINREKNLKPDILDKTIADIMKFNTESQNMMKNLKTRETSKQDQKITLTEALKSNK